MCDMAEAILEMYFVIHQACHFVEDDAKRSISYKSILHLFYFIAFPYGNPHPIQKGHYNPSYTPSLLGT